MAKKQKKIYNFNGRIYSSFSKAYAALAQVTNLVVPTELHLKGIKKGIHKASSFLLPSSTSLVFTLEFTEKRNEQIAQTGRFVESYEGETNDNICGSVIRYPDGWKITTYYVH